MRTVSWNEIPVELQQRVMTDGVSAVGDLASWAYRHCPGSWRNDDLHDLLCALIVLLVRGEDVRSLPAMLTAIAYRQKCKRYRLRTRARREGLPEDLPDGGGGPFLDAERLELCARLNEALRALSPDEREAVIRKHVFDESYREIAKALYGRSAGHAEETRLSVMLCRARRKLRDRLASAAV
jgi:RNA polymerase sigma factor (sigma-70 family)